MAPGDTRGNQVPLRRLLDHTSGIPDVTTRPELRDIGRNASLPREAMYTLIKRYPVDFPTGTAQIYSNSAFWLLHLVNEKASGMSYERYLEREPPRARPPGEERHVRRTPLNVSTWYLGSGALCSTAGDFVNASPSAMAADLAAEVLPVPRRAPGTFAGDAAPLHDGSGYILRRLPLRAAMLAQSSQFMERRWPLVLLGGAVVVVLACLAAVRLVRRRSSRG